MRLDDLLVPDPEQRKPVTAVAAAADREVLQAVSMAAEKGLSSFLLADDEQELRRLLEEFPELKDSADVRVLPAGSLQEAAVKAVKAVHSGEATVLMKGRVPTAVLMKAVLNPEYGLRSEGVLSHVAAFETAGFDRLLFVTDAGMNIEPDLADKAKIIRNAVQVAKAAGVSLPVVAPLAAVEVVNPKMKPTLDAAALVAMNARGQIKDCIVDGPLALDNAISPEAAAHKGLTGETAGRADILLVPDIEAGNILYKSLVYFAGAKVGAVIAGAKAPIVLTSRSDSSQSKLYSLGLALHTARH
ncbi:phosphate butyryltransferase [Indiicoccus explosivorum]|uniref:phosphate butyryltransferase n=1 Tax=Indiicoccus explosivorum TaxID=1917864 RepID=UPI000B451B8A|nr:phosphate butyryltransferase [Indiicoccus explosivorum]